MEGAAIGQQRYEVGLCLRDVEIGLVPTIVGIYHEEAVAAGADGGGASGGDCGGGACAGGSESAGGFGCGLPGRRTQWQSGLRPDATPYPQTRDENRGCGQLSGCSVRRS